MQTRRQDPIRAAVMTEELLTAKEGVEWDATEDALIETQWEEGRMLQGAPRLFASASYTYSQQIAEQEY